jgi:hypothetical protein
LAQPAADRIGATSDIVQAGVYSAVGAPTASMSVEEWMSVTELLSPYSIYPSLLDVDWLQDGRLRDLANVAGASLGLGYAWRNMRLEGALVSVRKGRELPARLGVSKAFTTTAGRLSYRPSSNLALQLARGRLSRQNLTDADDDVQRTLIAASYNRPFGGNNWQTILAIGRNTGKTDGGDDKVCLLESSVRVARAHTLFARIERASAGELFTDHVALYGQNFNANRLTLGYVYAMPLGAKSQITFGGLAAKRTMPQEAVAALGSDPPSYKIFMRLSLQMP